MLLLGIIGHPLAHSLGPVLHNWALAQGQIPGAYYLWDTPAPQLPVFISTMRTLPIQGVSVTIPHKETIISLLDSLTPTAKAIGAVNTLFWQNDQLWGDNTDITGFMTPLREKNSPGTALILGAGGAARAALYGLIQDGWKVWVTARTMAKAQALAQSLGAKTISWDERYDLRPDLLVNSTPLGMKGKFQSMTPWEDSLHGISLIYDLVYNPKQTMLVSQGLRQGKDVIFGIRMFLYQALAQFERWTGKHFSVDTAAQLVEQSLADNW